MSPFRQKDRSTPTSDSPQRLVPVRRAKRRPCLLSHRLLRGDHEILTSSAGPRSPRRLKVLWTSQPLAGDNTHKWVTVREDGSKVNEWKRGRGFGWGRSRGTSSRMNDLLIHFFFQIFIRTYSRYFGGKSETIILTKLYPLDLKGPLLMSQTPNPSVGSEEIRGRHS